MNTTGQTTSIGNLFFSLHLRIYRKTCDKLTAVASAYFDRLATPIVSLNQYEAVEYTTRTVKKIANAITRCVSNRLLFNTQSEIKKRRKEEIKKLRSQLGERDVYTRFSKVTANYLNEAIPRIVAAKFSFIPELAESTALYNLGFPARYMNHQWNKRTNARENFLSSESAKELNSVFQGLGTHFVNFFLGKDLLDSFLSWEFILLNISSAIKNRPAQGGPPFRLAGIVMNSVACSLERQATIDRELSLLEFHSPEESFIARLDWHKKNGSLPQGLPDPHQLSLDTSNLKNALDAALYKNVERLVAQFLDKAAPEKLKKGMLGFAYSLEGRDLLIKSLSFLLTEFGFKQLADPHLFALAILYSGGIEVAEYELDGFGLGKKSEIIKTGQKMLEESLRPEATQSSIEAIFEHSKLKAAPGSLEAIRQKSRAKAHLNKYILELIY